MEEIKDMNNLMSANDWRDRYKGITTLLEMCEINSNLVSHNIVKVCTSFKLSFMLQIPLMLLNCLIKHLGKTFQRNNVIKNNL